ncbi:orange carotenoid protein N-terminal domain-containing protein [Nostoc sp. UHCC 0302]|uniref:orange carotenoid protein N-terminal domain-containing protein n=1 Tax=Nostoc sp. UHCC 0302 TaxID=3134896 RepID=UPI00311CCCBF
MTSTNINFLEEAVSKFQNLDTDKRLSVLALLYSEIADEVPALTLKETPNETSTSLVAKIQKLSKTEQLPALRQLLGQSEGRETGISTEEYTSLSIDDKLAFWYQLAQNLGASIIDIPDDYLPSEEVTEVLDLLHTPNLEDLVTFLKRVL